MTPFWTLARLTKASATTRSSGFRLYRMLARFAAFCCVNRWAGQSSNQWLLLVLFLFCFLFFKNTVYCVC